MSVASCHRVLQTLPPFLPPPLPLSPSLSLPCFMLPPSHFQFPLYRLLFLASLPVLFIPSRSSVHVSHLLCLSIPSATHSFLYIPVFSTCHFLDVFSRYYFFSSIPLLFLSCLSLCPYSLHNPSSTILSVPHILLLFPCSSSLALLPLFIFLAPLPVSLLLGVSPTGLTSR